MHDLYKQENLPYLTVKLCPKCNELVPIEDEICKKCSYNFKTKKLENSAEFLAFNDYAVQHEIAEKNTVSNEHLFQEREEHFDDNNQTRKNEKEKFIYCDNCGAKIYGSQKYCGGCGAKVSKMICPNCEQIIDVDLSFCPYCGTKLKEDEEINSKTEEFDTKKSEELKEQLKNQLDAPFINQEELTNEVKIEEKDNENKKEEKVEEKKVKDNSLKTIINMPRKRLFAIIQLIFAILITSLIIMMPLLTSTPFFTSIGDVLKGNSTEAIITGKDYLVFIGESIKNNGFVLENIRPTLVSPTNGLIFSSMGFLPELLSKLHINDLTLSFSIVSIVYVLMLLASLNVIITSIVGLIRKTPLRGVSFGILTIVSLISSLLIYINRFFEEFKDYDSYLIYVFALSFIIWFIIKMVFLKESKIYKNTKLELKEKKNAEN